MHYEFDGDLLLKDSDEARDQEEFWDNKQKVNKGLLDKINAAIIEEFGEDPLKDDKSAQAKSLRNQFNFQERSCMTFNLPLREKGMKTDPPQTSLYSVETSQWMIFDAYMAQYESDWRQELEE